MKIRLGKSQPWNVTGLVRRHETPTPKAKAQHPCPFGDVLFQGHLASEHGMCSGMDCKDPLLREMIGIDLEKRSPDVIQADVFVRQIRLTASLTVWEFWDELQGHGKRDCGFSLSPQQMCVFLYAHEMFDALHSYERKGPVPYLGVYGIGFFVEIWRCSRGCIHFAPAEGRKSLAEYAGFIGKKCIGVGHKN